MGLQGSLLAWLALNSIRRQENSHSSPR